MLTRDSSTCTRILGYYLLGVGLIQLGILAWWQLHGADAGCSRAGLRLLSSFFCDLVGIDQAPREAYLLSLLWFSGLAVLMVRNRRPLKTYVVSEAILLPGTFLGCYLSFLSDRSGSLITDLVGQSLFFVFESAVPFAWAARLLLLERKAERAKSRPIPIWRTKRFGLYLLVVSIYQLLYLGVFYFRFTLLDGLLGKTDFSRFDEQTGEFGHIKGPANDLVFKLLCALDPRLGLDLVRSIGATSGLGAESISLRLLGISFLLGLAFAIFLLRGRQPLKTYLMFETLFGGPNVLLFLLAALFLSAGILNLSPPVWEWFAVAVVFISVLMFISVVPCIWTARLLWSGRRQRRANIETS